MNFFLDDDFPLDNDDLLAEAGESEGDGSNAEEDIVGKKMTNHSPW